MASSDSFFHLWVEQFIGEGRYSTYVLGHLAKPYAKKFWDEHMLKREARHLPDGVKPSNFEEICGGSMFLMNTLMLEYKFFESVRKDLKNGNVVLQQLRKLRRALEPVKTYPELGPPQWDKAQLLKVMYMLTTSEAGTIDYEEACKEMGTEVICLMIEYNLVHLRPNSHLAFDVPVHKSPIITAESQKCDS